MSAEAKTLVVDACIARAAGGEDARHPDAIHAREFLQTILSAGHSIGMTTPIQSEWNKHQSNFARKWRYTMVAKKRFLAQSVAENTALREAVELFALSEKDKSAMLKDCHLLDAAAAFDKRIASSDDIARDLFKQVSISIKPVRELMWVNPIADFKMICDWLRDGADDEQKWHLK